MRCRITGNDEPVAEESLAGESGNDDDQVENAARQCARALLSKILRSGCGHLELLLLELHPRATYPTIVRSTINCPQVKADGTTLADTINRPALSLGRSSSRTPSRARIQLASS